MGLFWLVLFLAAIAMIRSAAKRQAQLGHGAGARASGGSGRPGSGRQPESFTDLLAEVRRALEQARQQPRAPVPVSPEESDAGFDEEGESLEVIPERGSLEVDVRRSERAATDREREGEAVTARRLKWAAEHAGPVTPADHRAFDQQIRQPAPPVVPAATGAARLRQLVVWREILGPPVALRNESNDA